MSTVASVLPAGVAPTNGSALRSWSRPFLSGRLSELSAQGSSACLSLALALVVDAQRQAEPAAWITSTESSFFPPDAAAAGVDLEALVVVRIEPERGIARRAARAAELLARSGAYGLIVLDLGAATSLSMAQQSRLAGLAKKHDTALVCLTVKGEETPSIGSLVSLRAATSTTRVSAGRFECTARILKDKRRGPGWSHVEVHSGPPGLR